eukprot:NODE_367_length_2355_cov_12.967042_g342_i0.p1 GENE.NODE_367_length_2355_cov_12.967042_g342_i0~~NODE_367_length_2355_cov_12.967042_g342_i0.p1  ORF type:complete len:613 (-),score=138.29 NODE_367_length_2355_cov_12.967042_g342_i0:404-2242(-)
MVIEGLNASASSSSAAVCNCRFSDPSACLFCPLLTPHSHTPSPSSGGYKAARPSADVPHKAAPPEPQPPRIDEAELEDLRKRASDAERMRGELDDLRARVREMDALRGSLYEMESLRARLADAQRDKALAESATINAMRDRDNLERDRASQMKRLPPLEAELAKEREARLAAERQRALDLGIKDRERDEQQKRMEESVRKLREEVDRERGERKRLERERERDQAIAQQTADLLRATISELTASRDNLAKELADTRDRDLNRSAEEIRQVTESMDRERVALKRSADRDAELRREEWERERSELMLALECEKRERERLEWAAANSERQRAVMAVSAERERAAREAAEMSATKESAEIENLRAALRREMELARDAEKRLQEVQERWGSERSGLVDALARERALNQEASRELSMSRSTRSAEIELMEEERARLQAARNSLESERERLRYEADAARQAQAQLHQQMVLVQTRQASPTHQLHSPSKQGIAEWDVFRRVPIDLGLLHSLKLAFMEADSDRRGYLTVDQLGQWAQRVDPVRMARVTHEELRRMVAMVDLERRGGVGFWEFIGIQIYVLLGLYGYSLPSWMRFVTQRAEHGGKTSPMRAAAVPRQMLPPLL